MEATNRERVMEGLAVAVEDKGFAATTIADIARAAGVSKRTFYEEFADKDACFLALYDRVSQVVLTAMRQTSASHAGWPERLRLVIRTYLHVLRKRPELTRVCFLELNAAGVMAIAARRGVLESFAAFLREVVAESRIDTPALRELSPAMALALVAGINELVLLTIERNRSAHLHELEDTACALVVALTGG